MKTMKISVLLTCALLLGAANVANAAFIEFTSTFESGNDGWTLVNGSQPNKWVRGSGKRCGGSYSMYVSSSGSTYSYDRLSASVVHFYRAIGDEAGTLSFDVVGVGERGCYDYVAVSVASSVPNAGSSSGGTYYGVNYCDYTFCQRITLYIPAGAGNRYLIFTWRNDNNSGSREPIAIDNITYRPALSVTGASIAPKTYNGTTAATVTGVSFSESTDLDLSTDYTATATFDDATAGSGKTVTVTVTLKNTDKASAYFLSSSTYKLKEQSIAQKSISIDSAFASLESYSATSSSATVDSVWFEGLAAGDKLTRTTDYTVNATWGSDREVIMSIELVNDGATAKNYTLKANSSPYTFRASKKEIAIDSAFVAPNGLTATGSATVDSVWFEGLLADDKLTRNIDYTVDSAVISGCIRTGHGTEIKLYISLVDSGPTAKYYTLKSGSSPYIFYDRSILESAKRVIFVVGMDSWPLSDVFAFLLNDELKRDGSYEDVTRNSAVQRQVKALRRCEIAGNSACLSRCNLLKWSVAQGVAQVCLVKAQGDGGGGYTFSAEFFGEQGLRTASCIAAGTSAVQLKKAAWELAGLLRKSAITPEECCEP